MPDLLPIPAATPAQQKPVERLVERILAAKQRDAGEDVSALEREIGEAVSALYALTPEEIALVEGTMCPKYKVVAVDVERIGAAAETSTAQPETAAVS